MKKEENSFEEKIESLENIVSKLEKGDLNLDDSMAKFEEGMKLSKECSKILEDAEKKITILFNSLACFPAALLTPAASYITTNANINAIANIGVPTPIFFPINVASDVTTAECELGIPPAPNILLKLNFFVVTRSYNSLNSCIPNHNRIGMYIYLF